MKRFVLILLGCALIMGMSQCKKDNTNTPNNEGVRITLTADGSQDSKTDFDAGNFVWTNGATEYIYVGGSTHGYLGYLTGTGNGTSVTEFAGTLQGSIDNGEMLYFFYLGKGVDSKEKVESVSFANQDGTKNNVTKNHIAIGHAEYKSGTTAYNATLNMAMAIAWFNTSTFGDPSSITLSGDGIYNEATINYREGTITASTPGNITLSNGVSADCYVALLPYSTDGSHMLTFTNGSQTGNITFKSGIAAGDFYVSNPGSGATGLVVNPN